jgi:hypothetical protein
MVAVVELLLNVTSVHGRSRACRWKLLCIKNFSFKNCESTNILSSSREVTKEKCKKGRSVHPRGENPCYAFGSTSDRSHTRHVQTESYAAAGLSLPPLVNEKKLSEVRSVRASTWEHGRDFRPVWVE